MGVEADPTAGERPALPPLARSLSPSVTASFPAVAAVEKAGPLAELLKGEVGHSPLGEPEWGLQQPRAMA